MDLLNISIAEKLRFFRCFFLERHFKDSFWKKTKKNIYSSYLCEIYEILNLAKKPIPKILRKKWPIGQKCCGVDAVGFGEKLAAWFTARRRG